MTTITPKETIIHVDATPDSDYPLRILRAYRDMCNSRWANTSDGTIDPSNELLIAMNKMQEERAAILDLAIAKLVDNTPPHVDTKGSPCS
jgi:hypothetical protein